MNNLRIALYSHDTMGLGHTRRNLLIAGALARSPLSADVLLIAGALTAKRFHLPEGVDCVTLPGLYKDEAGNYGARSLHLSNGEIRALRSRMIGAALDAFRPDLFIVDKVPRGALGELEPVLAALRGGKTRVVLGLRDVLDDPETVRREWCTKVNLAAVRRHYDALWVYGDPRVYDLAAHCGFAPELTRKLRYVGYLDPRARSRAAAPAQAALEKDLILCLLGGGQDGRRLADAFVRARLPEGARGLLVTGPYMSETAVARLRQRVAARPDMELLEFSDEPTALLPRARAAVAMGGYNTVTELLAYGVPSLIVPRVKPRLEQLIRAERLAALGHLDMLHPDDLSAERLSARLAAPLPTPDPQRLDMQGLERLPDLITALLEAGEPVPFDYGAFSEVTYACR
jgi:predicted glycosyltransferase